MTDNRLIERRSVLKGTGAGIGALGLAGLGLGGATTATRSSSTVADVDVPFFDEQYAPQVVNAPAVWERLDGTDTPTIAVLSQGTDYEHPDIEAKFGDDPGYDFLENDEDPYPYENEGRGSVAATVAAASRTNGVGMAGIADANLLSGRIQDRIGKTHGEAMVEAIEWAVDAGADVLLLTDNVEEEPDGLRAAVEYAEENDTVIVTRVQTYGDPPRDGPGVFPPEDDRELGYPAAYDEVVVTQPVGEDGDLLEKFALDGPEAHPGITVCAPGIDVLATLASDDGELEFTRGSSWMHSAAVTAGVLALGVEAADDPSPAELRACLRETATDLGHERIYQGAGLTDAEAFVERLTDSESCDDEVPDCIGESETRRQSVTIFDEGDTQEDWLWLVNGSDTCTVTVTLEDAAGSGEIVEVDPDHPDATVTKLDDDEYLVENITEPFSLYTTVEALEHRAAFTIRYNMEVQ